VVLTRLHLAFCTGMDFSPQPVSCPINSVCSISVPSLFSIHPRTDRSRLSMTTPIWRMKRSVFCPSKRIIMRFPVRNSLSKVTPKTGRGWGQPKLRFEFVLIYFKRSARDLSRDFGNRYTFSNSLQIPNMAVSRKTLPLFVGEICTR